MKKIIGILGVAVIAATMFFSVNGVNGSISNTSLASFISVTKANAEADGDDAVLGRSIPVECTRWVPAYVCTCNNVPMIEVPGDSAVCMGKLGFCIPERCH